MVFVVVGILLAFQIDMWGERRNAREHTHYLFGQVHDELALNIQNCNLVLEQYRGKDTLVYDILMRRVTRQDYRENWEYGLVLLTQQEAEVSVEAFLNLVNSQDALSQAQRTILLELKTLYGTDKTYLDLVNEVTINNALDYHKKYKEEQTWYGDLFLNREMPEDMIDFCLQDPFYFNAVVHFQFINLRNHIRYTLNFRRRALDIHERLVDEMKLELDSTLLFDAASCQHIVGEYSGSEFDLTVTHSDGQLLGTSKDKSDTSAVEKLRIYPKSGEEFIYGDMFGRVVRGENDQVTALKLSLGRKRVDLVKTSAR
ncbi:MAG: hypothetical protein ACPGYS_03970 [Flavobacteriales bacterium]